MGPPGMDEAATVDPATGVHVMAYSPWPGRSSRMIVRFAHRAAGPWTRPVFLDLPGCADRIAERRFGCYAATVQPEFSSPGRLGVGWYDERVNTGLAVRGAYTVGSVALSST